MANSLKPGPAGFTLREEVLAIWGVGGAEKGEPFLTLVNLGWIISPSEISAEDVGGKDGQRSAGVCEETQRDGEEHGR